MSAAFLHFAAAVALVVTGILLLVDAVGIADGLALVSFALAALAIAVSPWKP